MFMLVEMMVLLMQKFIATTNNSRVMLKLQTKQLVYMGSTGDTVGNSSLAQTLIDV